MFNLQKVTEYKYKRLSAIIIQIIKKKQKSKMKFQMSFTLFFALFAILGNGKAMSEWNDNYQKQKAYNLDYLESYADELFKNFKESLLNKYKMLYEDIQEQENLTEPTPLEVDNVPEVYIVQNANKDVSGNSLISNSHFNKCQQDFQRQCIIAHNQYRSRHHSPPLMTDEDLQTSALNYAKTLAVKNAFEHSGQPGKGENLAYSWSSSVSSLSNCAGNL